MVEKYRLDNGLTILLEPIDSVVSVSVGLWVKSGSRDEAVSQYGYAHFVEHMLFKGTEKYSAREIAQVIDRVGGQHNAATNREYTCYYINVVSDHIDLALDILSDTYYNSTFDDGELVKEKNVIMEEIRMYEDTPDEFIHDLFMESMFSEHPLSHSILGTADSIGTATRDSLMDFYNTHYCNENTIIAIAGNFDTENLKTNIEKHFPRDRRTNYTLEQRTAIEPQRIEQKHIKKDLEQIHFCLGTEGIQRNDDSRWPLYALSTILGGSMSSRLFQNIREKEGIAYSVYSFHSSYSDSGIFGIYCATTPENNRKALTLIVEECRDILSNGISEQELRDARDFMKGNLALGLESVEVRMGQLAKNEIIFQKFLGYDDIIEKINSITMEKFNSISNRIFSGKKLSIVSVGQLTAAEIADSDLLI